MPDPILPYEIIVLRDGTMFKLAKPSLRDKSILLSELRFERRAKLIQNCKDAGLPAEQFFAEIESFDDKPPYNSGKFIEHFMNTESGLVRVMEFLVSKSLGKWDNPPLNAEQVIDGYDGHLSLLLIPLFGLQIEPKNPPVPEPTEINPTGNPPAYQQTT